MDEQIITKPYNEDKARACILPSLNIVDGCIKIRATAVNYFINK